MDCGLCSLGLFGADHHVRNFAINLRFKISRPWFSVTFAGTAVLRSVTILSVGLYAIRRTWNGFEALRVAHSRPFKPATANRSALQSSGLLKFCTMPSPRKPHHTRQVATNDRYDGRSAVGEVVVGCFLWPLHYRFDLRFVPLLTMVETLLNETLPEAAYQRLQAEFHV